MTCRIENGVTYLQSYNIENRMSGVSMMDGETCETPGDPLKLWGFVYDGDGVKVKQVVTEGESVLTTYYYAGGSYEVQTGGEVDVVRQYYSMAGTTVAMKVEAYGDTPAEWSWFLTDHLGSVVGVIAVFASPSEARGTDVSGVLTAETRYLPFGEARTDVGTIAETDFGYTFQRVVTGSGLMDYKARAYDPWLGRFVQPDTIVPGAGNPQAYNRYGYVKNNPINSIDPTGHTDCSIIPDSRAREACEKAKNQGNISDEGLEFIKIAEGGNQAMYNDLGLDKGNCTIGIGSFLHSGRCNGSEVQKKTINGITGNFLKFEGKWWQVQLWNRDSNGNPVWGVSRATAYAMLKLELANDAILINSLLKTQINQNQWDAIQSLVINRGHPQEVITILNESKGNYSDLDAWWHTKIFAIGNEDPLDGLVTRRKEEWELFISPASDPDYSWGN